MIFVEYVLGSWLVLARFRELRNLVGKIFMDTVAQMLTKIRNAQMAGKEEVAVSASKLKMAIAKILEKEGFIEKVVQIEDGKFSNIIMKLKYFKISGTKRIPAIQGIKRKSKQGQRQYVKNKELKSVKNNFGLAIISTPQGVMTGKESREKGLGGEFICEVW
ncbi:MAG: small subunit ribosomal protein [Patescibacteria group bacterium]|nr:small subunit ribosomal protein [Patescibacteria group bacterium]